MKLRLAGCLVLTACVALVGTHGQAGGDLKSGPDKKYGGAFDVKAITGAMKGKTLCYVWKYNGEARAAVVVVFSQKADENIASMIKSIDEVQKNNAQLGTVMVGVSGVEAADLEKLQDTHKLTTPLTIAVNKDGPKAWKLNKDAAVTVVVYRKGGDIQKSFAFRDTKAAVASSQEIAATTQEALKGAGGKKEGSKK